MTDKSGNRPHWLGYVVAEDLVGRPIEAVRLIDTYVKNILRPDERGFVLFS